MSVKQKFTRRTLLKSVAVIAPVSVVGCATTQGLDKPLLRADDPVARALLYYPNSNNVPADHPLAATHQINQRCENCVLAREEVNPGIYRCPTFPGKLVNGTGWCSIWAAKS